MMKKTAVLAAISTMGAIAKKEEEKKNVAEFKDVAECTKVTDTEAICNRWEQDATGFPVKTAIGGSVLGLFAIAGWGMYIKERNS